MKSSSNQEAQEILKTYKTIAVVGFSHRPEKPSHFVPKYLKAESYRIIPVNPNIKDEIWGVKVYPDLRSIHEKIDVVLIFRPSEAVPPIVEDAILMGAHAVWMLEGIINESAAKRSREAGLDVIMNKCMKKVHQTL